MSTDNDTDRNDATTTDTTSFETADQAHDGDRETAGDQPGPNVPVDNPGPEPIEGTEGTTTDEDDNPGDDRASTQAKRYRHRLRDAETTIATRDQTIEALQRQIIEDQLPGTVNAAALWGTVTLADLLDENGTVNHAAVDTAIQQAANKFGLPRFGRLIVPREGASPQGTPKRSSRDEMINVVMGREPD